jgi:hypothetical protein
MDLPTEFYFVSINKKFGEIGSHDELDFETPYPITSASVIKYLGSIRYVTLSIQLADGNRTAHIELSPAYARVVDDNNIEEINSNQGKY